MTEEALKDYLFPTGKRHVSFSEIKNWHDCPFRHNLMYIKKIKTDDESPFLDFGGAIHAGAEMLLETGTIDKEVLFQRIRKAWHENGFDNQEFIDKMPEWYQKKYAKYKLEDWLSWADMIWDEIISHLDEEFPGWSMESVEFPLYEDLEDLEIYFKGFIDAIFKIRQKNGKVIYLIVDWKTAAKGGWRREKKEDFSLHMQLLLYKHFWSKRKGIDPENVKTKFITLQRDGKKGSLCETVHVPSKEDKVERALKILYNMVKKTRSGFMLKNRESCKFCPFYQKECK